VAFGAAGILVLAIVIGLIAWSLLNEFYQAQDESWEDDNDNYY
jgi:hypothetical protein